ncbi:MAG: FtsQ-type POTRA domain-containing protein [Vallitalea sp.]|jgi:cell division protein FtsQ|nr:FtsQ-type POTRA domain-containing protein [Vallitalea sp.]
MSNVISINQVRKQKKKSNKHIWLIICIIFFIVVGAFQVFNVNTINITGNTIYNEEIIQDIVGINKKTNLFVYKLASKKLSIQGYPYIENIDIKYSAFNKVDIIVTEKNIISYIPYMGKYLCLDKDGIVIDYTNKLQQNIPIVHGLAFDCFIIGDKLFDDNSQIFKSILEISLKMESYNIKIDYIDFNYNDPKKIVLKSGKISVLIGDIANINRKFELLSGLIAKIPKDQEGIFDLQNPKNKNIIFTPLTSK